MTRCTDCFNKTAYCTCWIPELSKRCHWCFHFMDYCTCPDMTQARNNLKQKIEGLLISINTAERQMTEPLQSDAIRRLRDALLNENKAAQQEPAPLFGYCHPDNYERYSKFIADYFMSPIPDWQKALIDDVMHAYDKANSICVTCLKRPTHCNCEKQH